MLMDKHFVVDFDSTFTTVEALDILGEISLDGRQDRDERLFKIKEITDRGMSGELSFRESLEERIDLLKAHKDHLPALIKRLEKYVSKSFSRNEPFLTKHTERVYIVSNGFKDFIVPIVTRYGIKPENVFANQFVYGETGEIIGFDKENLLSVSQGKPALIKSLNLEGEVFVIGDGYNDYEIRAAGLADKFYAFTENIERNKVLEKADHIAPSFDEILYLNDMEERALSYPKNRIKVLLLENIHDKAVEMLKEEGYQVEVYGAGLTEEELCDKIKDVSILGIRSKTQVTAKVLKKAKRLLGIGAFCIGTNQIDLDAAQKKGVAVFNAPFSNTRSVVELAIGEIIMLMRNLPDRFAAMHSGQWNKSAQNSYEIRGKALGIIGYGNIGAQLSVLAESMGLKVFYYDIEEKLALGNAIKCDSLDDLLAVADVISMHVDGRPDNQDLFGKAEFDKMKPGTIFINLSRGHVVDILALKSALESGHLGGAAVDVFPEEPISNKEEFISELRGLKNVMLTPHIGGSTLEAQVNIAQFVPAKLMEYINTGSTNNSVNFPNITLPILKDAHRFIHLHSNNPGILAKINNILAQHDINIVGQYLKTNELVGYVITDINKGYDKEVMADLKSIEGTIKFRVLY
ncbi:MAG: phosphoglycerate dehydrogenase [Cyclobacteriaceae bacterium]